MSEPKLRFYLQGQESLLIQCAEELIAKGHTLCGVITAAEQISDWAEGRDIPLIRPGKGLADRLVDSFDYFFSITHLAMVAPEVIARAEKGAINFHDGPLPAYAGLYVTAWAVMQQERTHGISWHQMTETVDAGGIFKQRIFDLQLDETSFTLNSKCYGEAIDSFGELVDELASGTATPKAQADEGRSYFGLTDRPRSAATLDWSKGAKELDALIRGLDFGPVENPLALAKFRVGDEMVCVLKARVDASEKTADPGTITRLDSDTLSVATGDGQLTLTQLSCPEAFPIDIDALVSRQGLKVGTCLQIPSEAEAARITEVNRSVARYDGFWAKRLGGLSSLEVPGSNQPSEAAKEHSKAAVSLPPGAASLNADQLTALSSAYLSRLCNASTLHAAYRDATLEDGLNGAEFYFASHVPLRTKLDLQAGFAEAAKAVETELTRLRKRGSYARDTIGRHPQIRANPALQGGDRWRLVIEQVSSLEDYCAPTKSQLAVALAADGTGSVWHYDANAFSDTLVEKMQTQFCTFVTAALNDPQRPVAELPILSPEEEKKVLVDWNQTNTDYSREACVHELFEAQVKRRPDAKALAYLDQELSYLEFDQRANQLANYLRGLGVGPDSLVGVCVDRSVDMMVSILGVMKAGGAYVPMDPGFPADRIALMIADSQAKVLITQDALVDTLPAHDAQTLLIDSDWSTISNESTDAPEKRNSSNDLAYAIYTSGSTGRPKGVLVEHRNVVNFFVGMDGPLGFKAEDEPGVWLALTSLSFDISVLELLWTLSRGFKIVLHSDKADDAALAINRQRHADKPINFSLMYFASDEGENASSADKYKLLLEGAKFGDRNGFVAVWTPERHFHAFGGLYPNPSVASAALATITERIQLRAASVVMPLHHPVRVAEEWSLVDNLSNGRVGIAFAAGWQPNDFIIYKPERFEDRKKVMLEDMETVRGLWRGETLKVTSPLGKEIEVQTLPRPVQKELPSWLTAAGNPETFRAAGEAGTNLLTHLLGQTLEEVSEKIQLYRKARKDAGHEGPGIVTLMLHTLVGADDEKIKDVVREPMKGYLRSAVELVKKAAWTFPTFKLKADATGKTPAEIFEEEELSAEDLDAVLEHAFNRYHDSSGLFGTPSSCLAMIDALKGIDVDEVGCLLDYGVPSKVVMSHLKYLNELKTLAMRPANADSDYSLAKQIARHGVTHLQCTPSQMSLILAGEESRAALSNLKQVMVGGEAFPAALAKELRSATQGDITNMYGPTETTIWSSTQTVSGDGSAVPIGRPIANTQLYILDDNCQPVAIGATGELYIAGDGVVRGYHERPELTAERFVVDPFSSVPQARMYRTGDLARYAEDGTVEFLGRCDFQVKLRGYRIELGEIEAHIAEANEVSDAVVIAREDVPGDKRLVAYILEKRNAGSVDKEALRARLKEALPDYMVPHNFVVLDKFPLTPNAKVDRKALPAPAKMETLSSADYVEPTGDLETRVAAVWADALNVKQVGMNDNFFDLGGHSLLIVQVHRTLAKELEQKLSLTDLFRFPTIRSLVDFVQSDGGSAEMEQSKTRAASRKAAMSRRAKLRDRRRKA